MKAQFLGGSNREPFILDAAKALDRPNGGFVFVAPIGLDSFVSDPEHESLVRVVHGPKGCGKTSILLAKRLLLDEQNKKHERSSICIPARNPYPFMAPPEHYRIRFDSWATISAYAEEDTWTALWALVFGAYVVAECERIKRRDAAIGKNQEAADYIPLLPLPLGKALFGGDYEKIDASNRDLEEIGARQSSEELTDVVREILERKLTGSELRKLFKSYLRVPLQRLGSESVQTPIYIFVDSVDEMLRGHGSDVTLVESGGRRELDSNGATMKALDAKNARKIWTFAQSSLFHTSEYLSNSSNRRIRLVASMRSEAYFSAPRSKGETQNAVVTRIENSVSALREILTANISLCEVSRLVSPKATDAVDKFFGGTTYQQTATGIVEEIFTGLIRHTLEEPRDLMFVMSKLYVLSPTERQDQSLVKETVNAATQKVLSDYLTFMGIEWPVGLNRQVLAKIESNLLSADDLSRIAHSSQAEGGDEHPFCFLYSLGLIGVPRGNPPTQQFALATRTQFAGGTPTKLPQATHYLMHPVLVEKIKQCRVDMGLPEFRTNPDVIVGNGRAWTSIKNDPTRIVIKACLTTVGTKTTFSARVRIDGVNVSGTADSTASPLGDLSCDASLLFLSFMIALKRKWVKMPTENSCTLDEIFKACKHLRQHGFVQPPSRSSGRYIPFEQKFEAQYSAYLADNSRFPGALRPINRYLKNTVKDVAHLAVMAPKSIRVGSITAKDITLDGFPM